MFEFFKKKKIVFKQEENTSEDVSMSEQDFSSIAAPKNFQPIDVVTTLQTIPGKFDVYSSTWKYLQKYLTERLNKLYLQNSNGKLSMEKTQLLRGQIKEINLLFNHINQLAGVNSSPIKLPLDDESTGKGKFYE